MAEIIERASQRLGISRRKFSAEEIVKHLIAPMIVKSGRHNSKSEVLREGVRLVQEREARLTLLDAALARGIADANAGRVKATAAVFNRLEEKYEVMAKAKDR